MRGDWRPAAVAKGRDRRGGHERGRDAQGLFAGARCQVSQVTFRYEVVLTRRRSPAAARDRLEGSGPALRTISHADAQGQDVDGGRNRDRTRVGGLHLGHRSRGARRDDGPRGLSGCNRLADQQSRDRARRSDRVAEHSCSGGGEAMPGEPSQTLRGRSPRSTPATRPRQPRTNKRTCGIEPAHQSLIIDVFGPRLRLCTIHSIAARRTARLGVDST